MMKKLFVIVSLILSNATTIYAAGPFGPINNPYTGTYFNPDGGFGKFIGNLVSAATIVAGLGFLGYLLIGGFKYLTSGGDEKMVAEARKTLTYALMGLGIVVLALAITALIQAILGIDILHPQFVGPA